MIGVVIVSEDEFNALNRDFAVEIEEKGLIDFLEHPAPTTGHDSGIDNETLACGLFDNREKQLPILFVQVRSNIYELDLRKHVHCPNHFI